MKCYLCQKKLDDIDDDSWYISLEGQVPLCKKCSGIIARKFKAWIRSLRPKKKGGKK